MATQSKSTPEISVNGDDPRRKLLAVPAITERLSLPFIQQIRAKDGGRTIGLARWHAPAGEDGVVQLIDIHVDPLWQRRGVGSQMMREVFRQSVLLFDGLQIRPRRLWASVEQKRQVIARAFFTRHGFHHVAAAKNIFAKQEALIYLRSFD